VELVGRDHELTELRRVLDGVTRGSGGGVVVVVGPRGSGKTALAGAAAAEARAGGFEVSRVSPPAGQPGRTVWVQLLRDLDAGDDVTNPLLAEAGVLDLDRAARALAGPEPRLLVVDDVDRGGREAVELLDLFAARAASGSTVVVATAGSPLGIGTELCLRPLTEDEIDSVVGGVRPDGRHALWVASRGLPGPARALATELDRIGVTEDPAVHLALHATSGTPFLEVDTDLVRLLETAASTASDPPTRARLLARLAFELLGDASAASRRRALVDEAVDLARRSADDRVLAEVLDARLHALWDPAAATDRLAAASEIIDLARASSDGERERRGLFWRFVALMELGRVDEAEAALAAFARDAAAAGDAEAATVVTARHAMLATLRGRFDDALALTDDVATAGRRIAMPDTEWIVDTLRGAVAAERGFDPGAGEAAAAVLLDFSRRIPGQLYEATASVILAAAGRRAEAATELARVLPRALAGSGPRWLGSLAELALVATDVHDRPAAAELYAALLPYRDRLVVWGGANTARRPAAHYLGLLAGELADFDDAVGHLELAVAFEERIGALPGVADSLLALADVLDARSADGDPSRALELRARGRSIAEQLGMQPLLARVAASEDTWSLRRDGDDWLLDAGDEHARLRDVRGLHYLRALLAAPGREVASLDLAAGGAGLADPGAPPVLDDTARDAYRTRLAALDAELDAADRSGDLPRAQRAEAERAVILDELRRTTGVTRKPRTTSAEAERARVNVTRSLRTALDHIARAPPGARRTSTRRCARAGPAATSPHRAVRPAGTCEPVPPDRTKCSSWIYASRVEPHPPHAIGDTP
jgi:hypothetical protein